MFYSSQKPSEMSKSFSNENIFNFPSLKNSKIPLLPKTKDKFKVSSSLEPDQNYSRKLIPKLQKLNKNAKNNTNLLISSSLIDLHPKIKEADFFNNFMKRNSFENKEKDFSS